MTEFADFLSGNWLASAGTTFLLVGLAEIGDKSQLVCMTLAARHRGLPVVIGAIAAFAILNLLAVLFGAAVAAWLPEWIVVLAVAALFAGFGISALRYKEEAGDEDVEEKPGHGIVATTFLLIFLESLRGLGRRHHCPGRHVVPRCLRRPQAAQPLAATVDTPDQRRLLPATGDLRRHPAVLTTHPERFVIE